MMYDCPLNALEVELLDVGVGLSLSPRDLSILDCGRNSETSTLHFAISLATTVAV